MSELKLTAAQQAAVDEGGENILVSAAAGSGKTAVLVERVLRHINGGTDIDRLLIATFTNAAAAEMKEKIIKKLREKNPDNLQKQLRLILNADICTIDSFCLHCVKNHTHDLEISPSFRLCDEAENKLIIAEAADELTDALYEGEFAERIDRNRFIRLTQIFSAPNNDNGFKAAITELYVFVQSFAKPEEWLDNQAKEYERPFKDSALPEFLAKNIKRLAKTALFSLYYMLKPCFAEYFPAQGVEELLRNFAALDTAARQEHLLYIAFRDLMPEVCGFEAALREILAVKDNDFTALSTLIQLCDRLVSLGYKGAKSSITKPRGKKAEGLYEGFGELRDAYMDLRKRLFTSIANKGCNTSTEMLEARRRVLAEDIKTLCECAKLLSERVEQIKKRRSAYSFADIEHFAYRLFSTNTDAAQEYRERYDEILIDEYQDTNGLQDEIFRLISVGDGEGAPVPIFMVGDIKQSIYAFRGGDPNIFRQKSESYTVHDGGKRIMLANNFRSCDSVINAVNELFLNVMSVQNGGVDYKGEMLISPRSEVPENEFKAQAHTICVGDNAKAADKEAEYVAQLIKRMIDEGAKVKDAGGERLMQYKDITILSSEITPIAESYKKAFEKAGVPLYVQGTDYFALREIRTMVALIRVLMNKRRNISMLTLMRSPIGCFSDEELARLRLIRQALPKTGLCRVVFEKARIAAVPRVGRKPKTRVKTDMYMALFAAERGGYGELSVHAADFLNKLRRWQSYLRTKSAAELILAVYKESGFYDFLGALDGAEEAQANLRMFYEQAKSYESSGAKGMFRFMSYLDKLSESDSRSDGASLVGENHDVVRMMSIHKSKGLEFPVVILVSCGKEFKKVERRKLLLDKDAGIGLFFYDTNERIKLCTAEYLYVENAISAGQHSEDLRKLYVALTRPKERLITVCAYGRKKAAMFDAINARSLARLHEMPELLSMAKGFFDWILPVVMQEDGKLKYWEYFKANLVGGAESEALDDILNSVYFNQELVNLPSKTTVSAIKAQRYRLAERLEDEDYSEEEREARLDANFEYMPRIGIKNLPQCLCDESTDRLRANELGTAYHTALAYMVPAENADGAYIASELDRLLADGRLTELERASLSTKPLERFFKSETGKRFTGAYKRGVLRRESPFEMLVSPYIYDASLTRYKEALYSEEELDESVYDPNDRLLIQGIIDAWYTDADGEIVLIDYKTDRRRFGETADAFAARKAQEYRPQLRLYARALRAANGVRVKAAYLYLMDLGAAFEVDLLDGNEERDGEA